MYYQNDFLRGNRDAIPVMLGYFPVGLLLGAQAAEKGFEAWQVPLMTGLNFAGGSEFAAVEVWTSPPHLLLILAMTFLVNSRHLLMGATLVPYLRHLPKRKSLGLLFFMCDENWALGLNDAQKKNRFSISYYLGLTAIFYPIWILFPYFGALLRNSIGDITQYGFDMAFPAVFLVLMRGMWKGWAKARPWLVSLVVAALAYLFLPKGWYVALGALSGLVSAYIWAGRDK